MKFVPLIEAILTALMLAAIWSLLVLLLQAVGNVRIF